MNWEEKIKEGMRFIKEGCAEQGPWDKCFQCPFDDYCTTLIDNGGVSPNDWELEESGGNA